MTMEKSKRVLKEEQSHRFMEDLETFALSLKVVLQLAEALGRDFKGMLNGNNDEGENE